MVRGIHPPVLADRGLDGAVQALALDMAVPVEVDGRAAGRPPAPVESAVYFAVAECLANVGKHAGAQHAWVELSHDATGVLRVVVGDDGRGRRGPGRRHRHAGRDAAAGGLRRHDDGVQPGRRADDRHPGGAVRLVLAEDHALLRAGLTQLLEGTRLHVVARRRQRRRRSTTRCSTPTPTAPSSTYGCRRRSPTRGCAPRSPSARQRPGFPVLVLSQYVEQLYARELLASGEGAVGYLLKDRVSDVARVRRRASAGCSPAARCSTPRWSPR